MSAFPAPSRFEARLLTKRLPTEAVVTPRDGGVALDTILPSPSPASALVRAAAIAANPGATSLSAMPRRIVDQGEALKCCVSCALAGAMEALNPGWPALGPVFHYHVTRFWGGADAEGCLFLDRGIATLTARGICRESDHASIFTPAGAKVRPSPAAFRDARERRIPRNPLSFRYQHVGGTSRSAEIRRHLRQNHPVVATFTMPQNYPDSFLNEKFEWLDENMPPPSPGRHCVLIVAFDDLLAGGRGGVRVIDSHGTEMFDGGTWWMAYRILDSSSVLQVVALT